MNPSSGDTLTGPDGVLLPASSHCTVPDCDSSEYRRGTVNPTNNLSSEIERTGGNGVAGISDGSGCVRTTIFFNRS